MKQLPRISYPLLNNGSIFQLNVKWLLKFPYSIKIWNTSYALCICAQEAVAM